MNLFQELYPEDPPEPPKHNNLIQKKKKKSKNAKKHIKELFDAIRDRSFCADCRWDKYPALLEFHHVIRGNERIRNGRYNLSISPRQCTSVKKMETELKKGLFLCPTCHKIRHYNQKTGKVDVNNKNLT